MTPPVTAMPKPNHEGGGSLHHKKRRHERQNHQDRADQRVQNNLQPRILHAGDADIPP